MLSVQSLRPGKKIPLAILIVLAGVLALFAYLAITWMLTPGVSKYYGRWICKGTAGANMYGIGPGGFEINGTEYPGYSAKSTSNGITLVRPSGNSLRIEDRGGGKIFINGNDCSK